uniref:Uncharacterized protein n=1 Tax=Sphaerodactylus townsendi TaxID=933632 RepID=A0ACB8EQ35_9SAUR
MEVEDGGGACEKKALRKEGLAKVDRGSLPHWDLQSCKFSGWTAQIPEFLGSAGTFSDLVESRALGVDEAPAGLPPPPSEAHACSQPPIEETWCTDPTPLYLLHSSL